MGDDGVGRVGVGVVAQDVVSYIGQYKKVIPSYKLEWWLVSD